MPKCCSRINKYISRHSYHKNGTIKKFIRSPYTGLLNFPRGIKFTTHSSSPRVARDESSSMYQYKDIDPQANGTTMPSFYNCTSFPHLLRIQGVFRYTPIKNNFLLTHFSCIIRLSSFIELCLCSNSSKNTVVPYWFDV